MDETQPDLGDTLPSAEKHEPEPGLNVEIHRQNLIVNGEVLTAEDPAEILQYALTYNRGVIEKGVEDFMEYQRNSPQNKGAIVGRAPIIALMLGPAKISMTKLGQENSNDVKTNINEIKEKFHPFWHAIENAGYIPEARAFYSKYRTELRLYFRVPGISALEK